nr:small capsid protein [Macronycteris gammaherpesvirus 1]
MLTPTSPQSSFTFSLKDNKTEFALKDPIVQPKLEDIDPTDPIVTQLAVLKQGSKTAEEFEKLKKLYTCFLKCSQLYEEYEAKRNGVKRKKNFSSSGGNNIFQTTTSSTPFSFNVQPSTQGSISFQPISSSVPSATDISFPVDSVPLSADQGQAQTKGKTLTQKGKK